MKLLFVNVVDRGTDLPRDVPFELLSVATVADKLGHKTELLDINAFRESNTPQAIKDVFKDDEWDLIWLSASFTQLKEALDVVGMIRPLQKTAVIALGGKATTLMPEQILAMCPDLDIAVTGDQEGPFEDILDNLAGQRWAGIKGISYRQQGTVFTNGGRAPPADLESLPFLNYRFVTLMRYFSVSPLPFSVEAMQAKRRLNFSWAREYYEGPKRTVKMPSPARAVASIVEARFKYAIDFTTLADREVTVNTGWFVDFLGKYMDESLHDLVSWGATMDIAVAAGSPELVRMMKEAGCKYIQLSLREHNKEKIWQAAVDSIKKSGVAVAVEMTYGYPSDTVDSMASRAYFLFKNSLDAVLRPLVPYPDTSYFQEDQRKVLSCYDAPDPLAAFLTDGSAVKAVNLSPFDTVDLLGYGVLITAKDYEKILAASHDRLWQITHPSEVTSPIHGSDLDAICPVHKALVEAKPLG